MWILETSDPSVEPLKFRLPAGSVKTIGRSTGAEFIVDAALVSRLHCQLTATLEQAEHVRLVVEGDVSATVARLSDLPVALRVTGLDRSVDVLVNDAASALPVIMQAALAGGSSVRSVFVQEPDLETVFLHLTGKHLRD